MNDDDDDDAIMLVTWYLRVTAFDGGVQQ